MLKRVFSIILALIMALGLCGCGRLTQSDVQAIAQAVDILLSDDQPTEQPADIEEDLLLITEAPEISPEIPTISEPAAKPTAAPTAEPTAEPTPEQKQPAVDKNGTYDSAEDVALYIHTYGSLPKNYITKKQAEALGWEGGSVERYAPGKCIGGSRYGNYEKLLPDGKYTECDIDTLGKKSRGAKRLVFSSDGRIYYTEDHYESFVQLY